MSKKNKKRNKPYTGADAAPSQPVVHKYIAVQRSPLGEWWHTRKKGIILGAKIGGVSIIVAYLLYELLMMVF
ncbi:MAG TPA: hypothetical protein VJM32_02885 [Candidatus Saccharimonadales bacterium]|nr:hypothetical protein [Candidatus Saccharimonadales bacterium]